MNENFVLVGINHQKGTFNGTTYDNVELVLLEQSRTGYGYNVVTEYNKFKGSRTLPKIKTAEFLSMVGCTSIEEAYDKYNNQTVSPTYNRYGNISGFAVQAGD